MGSLNKSGVYIIFNFADGKYYVGSSKNAEKRWKKHLVLLRKSNHGNVLLQRAWDKYNEDSFSFIYLEYCGNYVEREQYYLDILQPWKRTTGYNICKIATGGDTLSNHPNREKICSKISATMSDGRLKGQNNPMYGKARPEQSKRMKENNPAKRPEVRKMLSERMLGSGNPNSKRQKGASCDRT